MELKNEKSFIEQLLSTPPWDKEKEKILLEDFRMGIVEEGEYKDDSIKWRDGNVLEFVEYNPEYSTIDRIPCKCWLTEEGILHARVNAGFYIEFMPPQVLHYAKDCGKWVARMVIDLFDMEIERKEDYLRQLNHSH